MNASESPPAATRAHPGPDAAVVWHDLECGAYRADLTLWRELAAGTSSPVLDIGAGTGRVALALARDGTTVIALDRDPVLLAECARRARGLPIETVLGDARTLEIEVPAVRCCLVPMQTVQLLDEAGRASLLRAARARTASGGLLACAIVDELQPFDEAMHLLPAPDEVRIGDVVYRSQPTAVRELEDRAVLERRREIVHGDQRVVEHDVTHLYRVTARELERAGRAAGWTPVRARSIPATAEHVGSTVVMLRA